jgi:tetratricopeptide (TPR) repeat protein
MKAGQLQRSAPERENLADRQNRNRAGTPPFAFRPSELLSLGNYVDAARSDHAGWQSAAACSMLGITETAFRRLRDHEGPQARFYEAVAHWMEADEVNALKILAGLDLPEAHRLEKLIRQPVIRVLAQLPWTRSGAADLLSAIRHDHKFDVKNVSFHSADLPNYPWADIKTFIDPDHLPDFFICQMIEWHVIPPNLRELPCPLFGQTSDYDLHIQAVKPWLDVFDEILVLDSEEWQIIRSIVGKPSVVTYPKSFGLPEDLPPLSCHDRDIDVFFSGTLRSHFIPEKAALSAAVLDLPDLKSFMLGGFLSPSAYINLLARSKATFTYIRRPTSMPTRGLEGLALGCATVVQDGSVLGLWAGPEAGVSTYNTTPSGLTTALREISSNWHIWQKRACAGAEIVRREFALRRVASQFMRFLTVRSALVHPRQVENRSTNIFLLDQRRSCFIKGWLPAGTSTLESLRASNLRLWNRQRQEEDTAALTNLVARETLLAHADTVQRQPLIREFPHNSAYLEEALKLYRDGIKTFPNALNLRFNFMRAALHFGSKEICAEGLQIGRTILNASPDHWRIETTDDIFPGDFFPSYFDYRRYLDRIVNPNGQPDQLERDLVDVILASTHFYLGHFEDEIRHFSAAVKLNPDFSPFQFALAAALSGRESEKPAATALLKKLANGSVLFVEARKMLAELSSKKSSAPFQLPGIVELEDPLDDPLPFDRSSWRTACLPQSYSPSVWTEELQPAMPKQFFSKLLRRFGAWHLRRRLKRHSLVAIFGMGPGGIAALCGISKTGLAAICGFLDNSARFHGRRFLGYPVYPVAKVMQKDFSATAVLLASYSRSAEMKRQLSDMGSTLEVIDFHYWNELSATRILGTLRSTCIHRLETIARLWFLFLFQIRLMQFDRVAIFGAGVRGEACYRICNLWGIDVTCFLDNHAAIQGINEVLGIPVHSPSHLSDEICSKLDAVIVSSRAHSQTMMEQLRRIGIIKPVLVLP